MKLKGSKVTSKFTLQRAKLPHQNKGREALLFKEEETPQPEPYSSEEDKTYSRYLEINPIFADLVTEFNLVHSSTNDKPKRVLTWGTETAQKTTLTPQPVDKPEPKAKRAKKETIAEFTARILEGYSSYSRDEVIERIKTATGVDSERAFKGFIKMRKDREIFKTPFHTYYLSSSTPF